MRNGSLNEIKADVEKAFEMAGFGNAPPIDDAPPVDSFNAYGPHATDNGPPPAPQPLSTITPIAWKGTTPPADCWLAFNRIPGDDLTLFAGNGGAGKTETAVQLCINVAADLRDWLGTTVESGPALFFSAEEPEHKIRKRVERICKHRKIDPHGLGDLHLVFPDLEDTPALPQGATPAPWR